MVKYSYTYHSVEELAQEARKHLDNGDYSHALPGGEIDDQFRFHGIRNRKELETLITEGYEKNLDAVLETAGNVVSELFAEHNSLGFHAYHDVSGGEVDINRFITGEPENMIEYSLVETPKFGNIVTLVSSISFSGAISKESIEKRGHLVAALAIALSRLGMGLEIWADLTLGNTWGSSKNGKIQQRILIKGANEDLDIGRVMFAFTHPAMLRILGLAGMHRIPREDYPTFGISPNGGYGSVRSPEEDMADGTIYLPSLLSDRDVPDADVKLREVMRDLGIITD